MDYCQKLKEKYEAKLKAIDDQLNDELLRLKPIIERWKKSAKGLEKERVFPPENARRLMSSEQLESRYPLFDPNLNLNYKHGKTFASQLKDPVNLSSPKQLAILLYSVLNAPKPKKTKIKVEFYRNISIIDMIIAIVGIGIEVLLFQANFGFFQYVIMTFV